MTFTQVVTFLRQCDAMQFEDILDELGHIAYNVWNDEGNHPDHRPWQFLEASRFIKMAKTALEQRDGN